MTSRRLQSLVGLLRTVMRRNSSYSERQAGKEAHARVAMKRWKWTSLLVAFPGVAYLTWKNLIVGEHEEEAREYFPWPHLRIRSKPFPWRDSDKTLLHNPRLNPGPEPEEEKSLVDNKTSWLTEFWFKWLFEDPEERERRRDAHLLFQQQKRERYLTRTRREQVPLQPMDVMLEIESIPEETRGNSFHNTT